MSSSLAVTPSLSGTCSVTIVGILSFFVCLGYTSLNETAAELEHPFGLGANHLPLTSYQRHFNSKLARLFDQTIPQLGYNVNAVGTRVGNKRRPTHCYAKAAASSSSSSSASRSPAASTNELHNHLAA